MVRMMLTAELEREELHSVNASSDYELGVQMTYSHPEPCYRHWSDEWVSRRS